MVSIITKTVYTDFNIISNKIKVNIILQILHFLSLSFKPKASNPRQVLDYLYNNLNGIMVSKV